MTPSQSSASVTRTPASCSPDVVSLIARLRKQAKCIYIAVEQTVADDIADAENKAADALESMMREKDAPITDEQIKHMVQRFLSWRLPEHFSPDAGISFTPEFNVEYNAARGLPPQRHTPVGTNLFDANQAEEMVRYMVEGLPRAALDMTVDKGE